MKNLTKKTYLFSLCCLLGGINFSVKSEAIVPNPANLSANAEYSKVTLTWDPTTSLKSLLKEDFEGEEFPANGWQQVITNKNGAYEGNPINQYTWFSYPTAYMDPETVDQTWIHSGNKCAVITQDMGAPYDDGTLGKQDEWLILPQTANADYLKFYTYIDPMVLEYGAMDEFPDHYYVKVSHDNGNTWDILWDARYDSNCTNGMSQVMLYLGDSSQGAPIVAFQALSDETDSANGLFFTWSIDDVELLSVENKTDDTILPEAYNIYLDQRIIASNVKSTEFIENSDKEAGQHKYEVKAISLSQNKESEKSGIDVTIEAAITNAPTNVCASSKENEEEGKYDISITWEAPEGERKPEYYNVYCNNALVAGYMEERQFEQTGKPKGAYTYSVVAVYNNPEGESDPSNVIICVGTRSVVSNLKTSRQENGDLTINWDAPLNPEAQISGYAVFRGNEKLAETTETSYTDIAAPHGLYDYSVKVIYADGEISLPMSETVNYGEIPTYSLPFQEDFTGGLTPANWQIEKIDGKLQDQYLWRFDNWYEIPVTSPMDNECASISSKVAGMSRVWVALHTPAITQGSINDGEKTWFEFDMLYDATGRSCEASLNYSYNNEEWAYVGGSAFTSTDGVKHFCFDITDYFVDSTTPVYFAWEYKGKMATYMAIDNVRIYNAEQSSIANIANESLNYSVNGNILTVNGSDIISVRVYSIDGICTDNVIANDSSVSVELHNNMNIIEINTTHGAKTIKVAQ